MTVALIDVDGTLLPNPSSERRFLAHLLRIGKLGPIQIGAALAFYARWGYRFGRDTGRKNKAYLANLKTVDIERLAAAFVAQHLQPLLRTSVVDRIVQHQRQGHSVALLTGTPDFIAAPLADLLGVETVAATRCAVRKGRYCAGPPPLHPLGIDKLHQAERLCRQLGAELPEATAYADSWHDRLLLARVGRPVVVAPDRRLLRLAREHGWEVLEGSAPWRMLDTPQ